MTKDTDTSGILLVDKPDRMTSHDVVASIRRGFGFSKVGHAGTLDPMATGLLVILIGKATKCSANFLNDDKAYEASIRLGIVTDTGDAFGRVLKETPCTVGANDIYEAMNRFMGQIFQVPPMFSAKRYGGKKLYQYARRGIEVVREPRRVTIKKLDILRIIVPEVRFTVTCSKGTYIRQLACDIGVALGCGAHLTMLRRIRSGKFGIEDALRLEEVKGMNKDILISKLIRV